MIDLQFSDSELPKVKDNITSFIRQQLDNSGTDGAVIGLSGGIDSSVTAYLAVEAIGKSNVTGLILPTTVSTDSNMSDAEHVATTLDIPYSIIEIDPIVDTIVSAVYPDNTPDTPVIGNVRARSRAVCNYVVANQENMLVLGTGNRSEAAVGYFTKYGDGAVDCHPIGRLYKQQVRQLASYLDVPDSIITKAPTAELWAGQTDEDELGITYDTLDAILALHIDGELSVGATARFLEIDAAQIRDVKQMFEQSEHKRKVPPSPQSVY